MTTIRSGARLAGPIRDAPVTHHNRPTPSWTELDRAGAMAEKVSELLAIPRLSYCCRRLAEEDAFTSVVIGAEADIWRARILETKVPRSPTATWRLASSDQALQMRLSFKRWAAWSLRVHLSTMPPAPATRPL